MEIDVQTLIGISSQAARLGGQVMGHDATTQRRQLRTVLRTVSGSTASPLRGSGLSAAGVAGWRMRPHIDGDYKHN